MADRRTRELALDQAVRIEVAFASSASAYDSQRVVNVAKIFEKYLGRQDQPRDEHGKFLARP